MSFAVCNSVFTSFNMLELCHDSSVGKIKIKCIVAFYRTVEWTNTSFLKCGNEQRFSLRLQALCSDFPTSLGLTHFCLGFPVRFWFQFSSQGGECDCSSRGGGRCGLPGKQSGHFCHPCGIVFVSRARLTRGTDSGLIKD